MEKIKLMFQTTNQYIYIYTYGETQVSLIQWLATKLWRHKHGQKSILKSQAQGVNWNSQLEEQL